jgi:hypothetical protein
VIKVMVDNTAPQASIKWDNVTAANPCATASGAATLTGTFKATDDHFYYYTLSVLPPTDNSTVPPFIAPTLSPPVKETFPTLAAPGKTSGAFTLNIASDTTPCGYVVLLQVWDRTIRNNHLTGNYANDSVGMCVLE